MWLLACSLAVRPLMEMFELKTLALAVTRRSRI